MRIGVARLAVAETLLPPAAAGGWAYGGWVASWQHGALTRDVLAGEPVELHIPGNADSLQQASSHTTGRLASSGWRVTLTDTDPTVRLLQAAVPDLGHAVAIQLTRHDPPVAAPTMVEGWPCIDITEAATAVAARLALLPDPARWPAPVWALDLLHLIRLLDDATLARLLAGIPPEVAARLQAAADAIPAWMAAATPRHARDLADGRQLLTRLLHVQEATA